MPTTPRIAIHLLPTLFLLAATATATATATAEEPLPRAVSPLVEWDAPSLEQFDPGWLHVKFAEGSAVEIDPATGLLVDPAGHDLTRLTQVLADATTVRRTFAGDRAKFTAWKALGQAASGAEGPDLSLWFDVHLAGGRQSLADALNALNALDVVEIAHPAPICEPAAIVMLAPAPFRPAPVAPGITPDFSAMQGYLYDTPIGLDAPSAWATPGGRGEGMKFIDVELAWAHDHEDFDQLLLFEQSSNHDPIYEDHGTAVMGEVVGQDNGFGVTGFASDAAWGTVGITVGEWPVVPQYFMQAAEALDPGDVWLIELQMFPPGLDATPMEWLQVNYDVIWTSSWALNVVCVEAGANGGQDLDSPVWGGLFDRDVRDSGAIMVGAGTPIGRVAESFTNYGSRMDAHGWGTEIVTTGYGDLYTEGTAETEYTSAFAGTSGASPMIAGSALCLQGIAKQIGTGQPLIPAELRQLITATGIPNLGNDYIGPRPDLAAAIDELTAGTCAADLDGNGTVDVADLSALIIAWGTPEADITGDGDTNVEDLVQLIAAWGPCA